VDKDVDDLRMKVSDSMDNSKWRKMISGNWSDRSNNSDAES